MSEELELELLRKAFDRHQESLGEMIVLLDRINESKESLRIALVNKGFDIPESLKLSEWIPYIEKGVQL